ncbi:DEAD/DEAH box helicase [Haloprofundus salilacus]|uniref:DEAD/DEAH box helicase n=1 Tax=Haloprofundus salilacus TaxID=2876190 RepID=UPI001CC97738|nr:DEAD/DEAH box helicase [Haloprofundus salilacus]
MNSRFIPQGDPETVLREQLLPHLRPETTDAAYLDRLSTRELVDFTYRCGVRTDEVGDGNCLVPRAVGGFDDAMFNNPSSHRVHVLVKRGSLDGKLTVFVEGFAGTYLDVEYDNPYRLTEDQLPAITIEGEQHSLYTAEKPFATTTPPVQFRAGPDSIPITPETDYEESIAIPGTQTRAAIVNPRQNFQEKRELDATGSTDETLSEANEDTATIDYYRPTLELSLSVVVHDDLSGLTPTGNPDDYVRLTVTMRNETDIGEGSQTEWSERRVFYPSLELDFGTLVVDFPSQQHDVKLQSALSTENGLVGDSSAENLYRQQDCYITRLVESFDSRWNTRNEPQADERFRTTSFGVYDYVEEEPVDSGYRLDRLVCMDDTELVEAAPKLATQATAALEHESLLQNLRAVLLTLRHYLTDIPEISSDEYDGGFTEQKEPTLHKFQWDAIQERALALLNDENSPIVVQAPTSAGKTVVYYGSTLLTIFERETRAAFPFPTRMLTEDKLEEVIELATKYNRHVRGRQYLDAGSRMPDHQFSVGVAIGQQYDETGQRSYLDADDLVEYIGDCDCCESALVTECQDCNSRKCDDTDDHHLQFPVCTNTECGFVYDFVFDVKRTQQYLPSLTVGTPEKFFTMPTVESYTHHSTFSTLPFYGAPYRECEQCGRALTDMNNFRVLNNRGGLFCFVCGRNHHVRPNPFNAVNWRVSEPYSEDATHSPIGHIVLDETHMYTGQFGIAISVILRFFEVLASRLQSGKDRDRDSQTISADSGTATISNKLEHISRLLRTPEEEIAAIPGSGEHGEYFTMVEDRVRYRIVAATPVATSNRGSFREAIVQLYDDFHNFASGTQFRNEFEQEIQRAHVGADIGDYEFILGYLHRKSDGYSLRESIGDRADQISDGGLDDLQFISGESSKSNMRAHMGMGTEDPDHVVLANLVVSLGIDIPELNNLLLFGAPRSMSEQMQTIGRTGRDKAAGHATIHLYPGKPRDMQLERKFHQLLGNVDDYYDIAAIHPTNPYLARILFEYLLGPFLTIEYAIREKAVDRENPHDIQDLVNMFDDHKNPLRNPHARELYLDMKSIFCPDDLQLDHQILEVIDKQITEQLFGFIGDAERESAWFDTAIRARTDNTPMNINEWFSEYFRNREIQLRGPQEDQVETSIEWTTPSEVTK